MLVYFWEVSVFEAAATAFDECLEAASGSG